MSSTTPFTLDRFQLDAIAALDEGRSVLVAAPTGSGKTVVADAAIDMTLAAGGKAFYTTPIKALSNQKYTDLVRRLGPEKVGLLTGDNSINGDAPVVVMTTEVLRNMIYASSPTLQDLHVVVLDEVHYLQDAYRGPVWEEVIIHLPQNVRLVCLSATVSNADELGDWLTAVRGPTETIVESERPVELDVLYMVADRNAPEDHLVPVLIDGRPNPEGQRFVDDPRLARRSKGRMPRRFAAPRRIEVVERLADEDLLPVIYFIFSRAACDDALAACRDAGIRLTDPEERLRIRTIVEDRTAALSDRDLDVLGYDGWLSALEMGFAAHHAGMLPAFKEAVETCFTAGLTKVVFATETLALGINMPARSVVIEKLSKFNGEGHQFLTAGEFTQLTGRAGRRGIDDAGFAVVVWSPFVPFDQVAALAASRSFPLRSSFRATYNMTANLVARYERSEATTILGQSFAQFQADRAMVGMQRRLRDGRATLVALDDQATCDLGDVETYVDIRTRLDRARRKSAGSRVAIERSAAMLRPGDIVQLPGERDDRAAAAIVISVAHRSKGAIRLRAVDGRGEVHVIDAADLEAPVHAIDNVELPTPYDPGDPVFLDACAARVVVGPRVARSSVPAAGSATLERLIDELESHPVAICPDLDRHLEAIAERGRVMKDLASVEAAVTRRSGSVIRRFDAVVDLLEKEGFIHEWSLTAAGRQLAAIYHESDLLVASAIRADVFDRLDPPSLAAVVSMLTYEERRADARAPTIPPPVVGRYRQLQKLATALRRAERERALPETREPDAGFAAIAYGWASGRDLANVLADDLSVGDFYRNVKMLIDLLRQLGELGAGGRLGENATRAADALERGIIEHSGPSVSADPEGAPG